MKLACTCQLMLSWMDGLRYQLGNGKNVTGSYGPMASKGLVIAPHVEIFPRPWSTCPLL